MRFKVYEGERYDILAGSEHEGNTLIQTYVHKDALYPTLTIEAVNDMLVMVYATFSDGAMHGLEIVHAFEIMDRYDTLRRIQDSLMREWKHLTFEQTLDPYADEYLSGCDFAQSIIGMAMR